MEAWWHEEEEEEEEAGNRNSDIKTNVSDRNA
jgi:hypothetical protein